MIIERFIPYVTTRTFSDPTAERAIGFINIPNQFMNTDSLKTDKPKSTPQTQIEREIHELKVSLSSGQINRAVYREKVDSLRSSLKHLMKGQT